MSGKAKKTKKTTKFVDAEGREVECSDDISKKVVTDLTSILNAIQTYDVESHDLDAEQYCNTIEKNLSSYLPGLHQAAILISDCLEKLSDKSAKAHDIFLDLKGKDDGSECESDEALERKNVKKSKKTAKKTAGKKLVNESDSEELEEKHIDEQNSSSHDSDESDSERKLANKKKVKKVTKKNTKKHETSDEDSEEDKPSEKKKQKKNTKKHEKSDEEDEPSEKVKQKKKK